MYLLPHGSSMIGYPDYFGVMTTPSQRKCLAVEEGRPWAVDNEALSREFDLERFVKFLDKMIPYASTCLFIVLPDVVAYAEKTLSLYWQYRKTFREYPYPLAFVAQDGIRPSWLPPDYDVLFIGGSTEFKLGKVARDCIAKAKVDGKKVHVGRVNTARRLNYCNLVGADTVDGTCIAFGFDTNLARLNRWMPQTIAQRTIYESGRTV